MCKTQNQLYRVRIVSMSSEYQKVLMVFETKRFSDIARANCALVHVMRPKTQKVKAFFYLIAGEQEFLLSSFECYGEELAKVLFDREGIGEGELIE